MMTMVAPTPMMANALASVAIWMSVYAFKKLFTEWPVVRSTWDPATSVSAAPRITRTTTRPICWDRRRARPARPGVSSQERSDGTERGYGLRWESCRRIDKRGSGAWARHSAFEVGVGGGARILW